MISFIVGVVIGYFAYQSISKLHAIKIKPKKRKYDKHLHLGGLLDD